MKSSSHSRPNKRPYHMVHQQHGWPHTVDTSTIPTLPLPAPPSSPTEVVANNHPNSVPQTSGQQDTGNTSIGPVVRSGVVPDLSRQPYGPSPSHNFASRRQPRVRLIFVELRRELTFFKVPPPSYRHVNLPQAPVSVSVIASPRAPPSTSVGVADLPHNSETNSPRSASAVASNTSLPTPTNMTDLIPTPASSEMLVYSQEPLSTHDHAHAHIHHDHLPPPPTSAEGVASQAPLTVAASTSQPSSTQSMFQNFLSDVDVNMDHIGLMSIPGEYDISYDVSTPT